MGTTFKLVSVISALLIVGCAGSSVKRGLYEGIKVQRDLHATPSERADRGESPDYQSYERMRKERLPQ
ncbi:hypothetical protein [Geomonas propionica]|uniref:Lipoprotein n=1 Tax=Geomonas propionica TaxID=2798582 RepID=A0ABS0YRD3_9BACT|nr:hypothetical protein [Geomonas propionica]MBJ6800549.1 hypothetical protein [Geomonas propionica]